MEEFSLDYAGLMSSLDPLLDRLEPGLFGAALLAALADRYKAEYQNCELYQFEQAGASYLYDLASALNLPQEDRTVAAWALTSPVVPPRTAYQRGFPAFSGPDFDSMDLGFLIPHFSGGEYGPNIYLQDRAMNRGWSVQGRRFRALERKAARTPGSLYFAHLIYADDTAHPSEIEVGLLRGTKLQVELFNNRP